MIGAVVNKSAIARNFSCAADQYDVRATAQAEIALGLARCLPEDLHPSVIVDLGCGTGLLSVLLLERFPDASLIGFDLAEGMVDICRRRWSELSRARFVVGDVENPAHVVPGVELVTCSCAAQWFSDPVGTLKMWSKALVPGGILACAFLMEESFTELKSAYQHAIKKSFQGLHLWNVETIPAIATATGLKILCSNADNIIAGYESARAALRSFQWIGAALKGQPGYMPLTPGQMRRLLVCYDEQSDRFGRVTVTHRVQYLVAEKLRIVAEKPRIVTEKPR